MLARGAVAEGPVPAQASREVRVRPPAKALVSLGEILTHRVRPTLRLAGRTWPTFGVLVSAGVILGSGWAVAIAAWRGLSPLFALLVMLLGLATALALALATKAVTGAERFTFHHYQLAVLATGGSVLYVAGRPVLAGLDLLAVALCLTQGVGRLGCLGAGCCHGRAALWGVRYGEKHAAEGFPRDLVGVRLLPVQLVESVGLALLAAAISVSVLSGGSAHAAPPGTALALYLCGGAFLRFLLERFRGDHRGRVLGLSEAQWTALAVLAAVAALGRTGRLPIGDAAPEVAFGLFAVVAAAGVLEATRKPGGLLSARHATEIAGHLCALARAGRRAAVSGGETRVEVRTTSERMRLSTGRIGTTGTSRLVSFSAASPFGDEAALGVARRLLVCAGAGLEGELVRGRNGVWHLIVPVPHAEDGA
jgi:hypothetical protein